MWYNLIMKKNRSIKGINTTDLVQKLEYAAECTRVCGDYETVSLIGDLISQIKEMSIVDNAENKYLSIEIDPKNALIKADTWYKMAFIDFESRYGVWIPKVFDICKKIRYIPC